MSALVQTVIPGPAATNSPQVNSPPHVRGMTSSLCTFQEKIRGENQVEWFKTVGDGGTWAAGIHSLLTFDFFRDLGSVLILRARWFMKSDPWLTIYRTEEKFESKRWIHYVFVILLLMIWNIFNKKMRYPCLMWSYHNEKYMYAIDNWFGSLSFGDFLVFVFSYYSLTVVN